MTKVTARHKPKIDGAQEAAELRMGNHFHTRHAHKYVFAYTFLVVLALALGGIYSWQQHRLQELQYQIRVFEHDSRDLQMRHPVRFERQ